MIYGMTILDQLTKTSNGEGYMQLKANVGMFFPYVGDDCVEFGFRGSGKFNKCMILLNADDLYDLIFTKFVMVGGGMQTIVSVAVEGVDSVSLPNVFLSYTGISTTQ